MRSHDSVLIVEDDAQLRSMYRIALTLAGFKVAVASDGLDALRQIDASPPSLVVLDLSLPIVNGIVVRQQIAASALTRHIPIVIVTGTPERAEGLSVACVLSKPVSPERLVAAARTCLAAGSPGVT